MLLKGIWDGVYQVSPSTRRAWIEINNAFTSASVGMVMSPSTRRAWIEIAYGVRPAFSVIVALHPEGVDRNLLQ